MYKRKNRIARYLSHQYRTHKWLSGVWMACFKAQTWWIRRLTIPHRRAGSKGLSGNLGQMPQEMLLVSIAFNEPTLIERQIIQIQKHVTDEAFKFVVVDNSTRKAMRRTIKAVCERLDTDYVAVPRYITRTVNTRITWAGNSHGTALNYAYYQVIDKLKPHRFAIIDHDVFPIEDCNLTSRLGERDFYGVVRHRPPGWYLWPGWCLFRYDVMAEAQPDFLPCFFGGEFLDAGGSNYQQLYRHYNIQTTEFPNDRFIRFRRTKHYKMIQQVHRGDCVELIDESWMHLINGSNYAKIVGKEEHLNTILDNFDRFVSYVKSMRKKGQYYKMRIW